MVSQRLHVAHRTSRVIFLVGPTAVGKSAAAAELAKKINAEIISCDSMQIYKGMDIITSQPTAALRNKIPHHLVAMLSPCEEYNVSEYRKDALEKIKEIINRGKTPLFVGGTGLYMSILLDGIFSLVSQDKTIRKRFYCLNEKYGSQYLYKRLERVDLQAALKIHPHDTKRIVRALEVFAGTGKPISSLQKQREGLSAEYDTVIFGLNMERGRLYQKIDERTEKMFSQGLLQEAEKLLKLPLSRTARYAIGINELKGYLAGAYDLEQARQLIKQKSRRYAKRQLTWFRKDKRIRWFSVGAKESPAGLAARILKQLRPK